VRPGIRTIVAIKKYLRRGVLTLPTFLENSREIEKRKKKKREKEKFANKNCNQFLDSVTCIRRAMRAFTKIAHVCIGTYSRARFQDKNVKVRSNLLSRE